MLCTKGCCDLYSASQVFNLWRTQMLKALRKKKLRESAAEITGIEQGRRALYYATLLQCTSMFSRQRAEDERVSHVILFSECSELWVWFITYYSTSMDKPELAKRAFWFTCPAVQSHRNCSSYFFSQGTATSFLNFNFISPAFLKYSV